MGRERERMYCGRQHTERLGGERDGEGVLWQTTERERLGGEREREGERERLG